MAGPSHLADSTAPSRVGHGVCLVVSSFHNDDAIERLLGIAFRQTETPFCRVIVVDSLGTGRIPELLRQRAWEGVEYHSFPHNLGSAGNLAERLRLAAQTDAEYAYAINHDAELDLDVVRALLDRAAPIDRLGALYPLRRLINRGDRLDTTGARTLPLPFSGVKAAGQLPPLVPVQWSSSNGALYALAPIRSGLTPWSDFWFGWEDLAYGWLLSEHGYHQYITSDVQVEDNYEYRRYGVGPVGIHLTDKPAWYAYYQIRNLMLAARRIQRGPWVAGVVAARIAQEFALTALFRGQKRQRFHHLICGLVDGLRGRSGKWVLP
jgi:hypothetical protein